VRRVECIQHLEVFKDCRKECVQESFLRLRVTRKIKRDSIFIHGVEDLKSWSSQRKGEKVEAFGF
jgi:hypothetical protein